MIMHDICRGWHTQLQRMSLTQHALHSCAFHLYNLVFYCFTTENKQYAPLYGEDTVAGSRSAFHWMRRSEHDSC